MENTSNAMFPTTSNDTTTADMIFTASTPLPETSKTFIVVLGMLINVFGLVGNTGILIVIHKTKSLRKPYNIFIASMAVNDVILCGPLNIIQVVAIHFGEFPFNWFSQDTLCRVHNIAWVQFLYVSLMHITVIAIHRYLLVFHQKLAEYLATNRNIIILVFFLHLISFLVFCTPKLSSEHRFIVAAGTCISWTSGNIIVLLSVGMIALTTITLLWSYISIHLKVAKVRKQVQSAITAGQPCNGSRNNLKNTSSHKIILQCMFIIILLSVCCYLPVILCFGRLLRGSYVSPSLLSVTVILVMASNSANSVVYCSLDSVFRKALTDQIMSSWSNFKRACRKNNRVHPIIQ